ncbi:HAUS1 protein, partial [Chloroceryle aenea]|nr:HAUS1 protein [Chloroceryle aenea]
QVTSWLKTIYGNYPVPEFEVNAETVDVLYKLAEYSNARDRDMALLIEDMKQRAIEHEEKAEFLHDHLMKQLGPLPYSLSEEGTNCLDILVSSAMLLETNNTSLTSLFSAINDRNLELYEVESENRKKERELRRSMRKLTSVLLLETQLEEHLKKCEERLRIHKDICDIHSQNLTFLKRKSYEIKIRIEDAERTLCDRGFDQSLTHEALVKLSE